jgi:cysteinyl-tRNA synthetase
VKLFDPAVLLRAREEKAAVAADKAARKAAQAAAEKEKRLAKLEKGKLAANEMFKPPNVAEGAYGSWNEDGIPLTDGSGVELPKSRVKRNAKEWEIQRKAHADWVAYLKANEQA